MAETDFWRQANTNPAVRKHLESIGRRVASRATALSRAEGGTATYSVDSAIRPGGRARVNVVSSSADEEFGTEKTRRIGALRRAVRGG